MPRPVTPVGSPESEKSNKLGRAPPPARAPLNLLKFRGTKLPGGVELNGREIYEDAEKDIEKIRENMSNTYELPPLDMIG